jgi:hypothetical protein
VRRTTGPKVPTPGLRGNAGECFRRVDRDGTDQPYGDDIGLIMLADPARLR